MKNRRGFLTLFLSNCLILFLALIVAIADYAGYQRSTQSYTKEYNQIILRQVRNVVDERISSANHLLHSISSNASIERLATIKDFDDKHATINSVQAMQALESYARAYSYVDSIYVYFKENDAVITTSSVYRDMDTFLQYSDHAYWTQQDWEELFTASGYVSYSNLEKLSQGEHRLFTIVHRQNPFSSVERGVYIVLNLDYSFLEQFGQDSAFFPDSTLVALAPDKKVMFSLGAMPQGISQQSIESPGFALDAGKKGMMVERLTSSENDWGYYIVMPENLFVGPPSNVYLFAVLLLIFLVGIPFAFRLAKINFRPIHEIVSLIKNQKTIDTANIESTNEIRFIEQVLLQSVEEYKSLSQAFTGQVPIMRMHHVASFLSKGFSGSSDKMEEHFQQMGIEFYHPYFTTAAFHLDLSRLGGEERSLRIAQFQAALETFAKDFAVYTSDMNLEDTVSAIINLPSPVEDFTGLFESYYRSLVAVLEPYEIALTFAVGKTVTHLEELPEDFVAVSHALQARLIQFSGGLVYSGKGRDERQNHSFYYPQELETRLITAVKYGNISEVHQVLDTVIIENFTGEKVPLEASRGIMFSMMNTALRIISSVFSEELPFQQEDYLNRILNCHNLQDMEVLLRTLYTEICQYINSLKSQKQSEMITQVLEYIHENYKDNALSLISVAEAVGMNSTYLSTYFKEQTDENFQSYVNELRLEKSLELLSNLELTVGEIAVAVGYTNSSIYIRNFRKTFGDTPGEYRKNQH